MPVYCYKCRECDHRFESRHSMNFDNQACIQCGSENVFKVPSIATAQVQRSSSAKPGRVVDEYIKDTRQEIKKEKQKLKTREL